MNTVINESFEIHDTLNPKLWDINTGKLLTEVRNTLINIVDYFEKFIEAPITIIDVQLVGSNCSFNYTPTSDLDVHLIANFDRDVIDAELLKSLYTVKLKEFNSKHDITVRGIKVELYVQDVMSNVVSNGIYSLCDDEWVKEPKPIKSATKHNTDKELEKWREVIKQAVASNNYDTIIQTLNTLYLIRHNSIAIDGENGKGNQLFKDIRSEGLLQRLKDASFNAKSMELSLDGMSGGQLVNRYDE